MILKPFFLLLPWNHKYHFSYKQLIQYNEHLTIYSGRHCVWDYLGVPWTSEREALRPTLIIHVAGNNVNFMKCSPSSGSIERLLVVFIKCPLPTALVWPYKGTHDIFPILHMHCSKGNSQSVNLLSDSVKAYSTWPAQLTGFSNILILDTRHLTNSLNIMNSLSISAL